MSFCGGCGVNVQAECVGAFERHGIVTVHWECWSRCNLGCSFCYRTISEPLETDSGRRLIDAVCTSGAKKLVFAGGDPSLRPDLFDLCEHAKKKGLWIEVQTNAHHQSEVFLRALALVDCVALSLDAGVAASHDELRGTRGNFERVLGLMDRLVADRINIRVHTVATVGVELKPLAELLRTYPVLEWGIQEMVPVGEGYAAAPKIGLLGAAFDAAVAEVIQEQPTIKVRAMSAGYKRGLYALVKSDGQLYGTGLDVDEDNFYPTVGNILHHHLGELGNSLVLDAQAHRMRYAN